MQFIKNQITAYESEILFFPDQKELEYLRQLNNFIIDKKLKITHQPTIEKIISLFRCQFKLTYTILKTEKTDYRVIFLNNYFELLIRVIRSHLASPKDSIFNDLKQYNIIIENGMFQIPFLPENDLILEYIEKQIKNIKSLKYTDEFLFLLNNFKEPSSNSNNIFDLDSVSYFDKDYKDKIFKFIEQREEKINVLTDGMASYVNKIHKLETELINNYKTELEYDWFGPTDK